MVTDRDIVVRAVADGRSTAELTVRDVLTPELYFCRESDSVEDAADIMAEHQVRRLPVLDEGGRVDVPQARLVLNDGEANIRYPGLMTFHDRPQRCLTEREKRTDSWSGRRPRRS